MLVLFEGFVFEKNEKSRLSRILKTEIKRFLFMWLGRTDKSDKGYQITKLYILMAFFTIMAPGLAGLQTFLKFPERANTHR